MSDKRKKRRSHRTRKKAATTPPAADSVTTEENAEPLAESPAEQAAEAAAVEETADGGESTGQLKDRLLRLQADFDNFRRRTLREKDQLYRNANEDIMLELLPVLDHLELALNAVKEHGADNAFFEGFKLVSEQMSSVLGRFGLTAIAGENGAFDPNLHEAISHLSSDEVPSDEIVAQVRRGYKLGERVLRAAQVVVSSGPTVADVGEVETATANEKSED